MSDALHNSWSLASSTKWSQANPASGQCSVTALVVQDYLGGDILKTKVGDLWHSYNFTDQVAVDFTKSQFDTAINYDEIVSNRDKAFADTNQYQYNHLKAAVQSYMQTLVACVSM